jgi:hypothetical protein
MIRSTDGATLFDVLARGGETVSSVVIGQSSAGTPQVGWFPGGYPLDIIASSAGFPPVGSTGDEGLQSGDDMDYWSSGGTRTPIFGDASIAALVPESANTTTLFWIRAILM